MTRSKLKNAYLKNGCKRNKCAYTTQRNLCTKMVRNAKKEYYSNLNPSLITDNKNFWKSVKPLFSEKKRDYQC